MRFGRQLREERERLGVSVEEIARVTRVPLRQLLALEADLFDELPPGVVRRGIVRSYCKHTGLDDKLWVQKFAEAGGLPAEEPDQEKLAEFAENIRRGRQGADPIRRRWLWVVLIFLGLGAAGFAAWKLVIQPRVFPASRPAMQPEPPAESLPAAPAASPSEENTAPPRNTRKHHHASPQPAAPVN